MGFPPQRIMLARLHEHAQGLANGLEREQNPYHKAAQKIASQLFILLNDKDAREACEKKLEHEAMCSRIVNVPNNHPDSIFF